MPLETITEPVTNPVDLAAAAPQATQDPNAQALQAAAAAAAPAPPPAQGAGQDHALTQQQFNWLQELNQNLGVDLRQVGSEADIVKHLAKVYADARQLSSMVPYAQAYLQHADAFQQYLAERQRPAAPAAPGAAPAKWWDPPEYDPAWLSQVTQDDQGNLIPKPGQSPEIVARIQRAQAFRDQFVRKFLDHPIKALEPGLREFIEPIIREQLTGAVGQYKANYETERFAQENGDWLFAKTPQGAPLLDFQGNWVMSPAGQRFVEIVRQLEPAVPDLIHRRALAKQILHGEALQARIAQQAQAPGALAPNAAPVHPLQAANEQKKQAFLQQALAGTPNVPPPPQPALAHQANHQGQGALAGLTANLDFEQQALKDLRAAGYDDNYFAQQYAR